MLQYIIEQLSENVSEKVQKTIPLASQRFTSDGAKMFPAIYVGNGQYKEISIDNFAGLTYFRTNGKVSISEINNDKRAMQDIQRLTYPLRLVCAVKNSVIGKDDEFTPDTLALSFIKDLQDGTGNLKSSLNANYVTIQAQSYDTDVKDILNEEYSGIERLKVSAPYSYSLISIDLTVEIIISAKCINLICNTYCNGS